MFYYLVAVKITGAKILRRVTRFRTAIENRDYIMEKNIRFLHSDYSSGGTSYWHDVTFSIFNILIKQIHFAFQA